MLEVCCFASAGERGNVIPCHVVVVVVAAAPASPVSLIPGSLKAVPVVVASLWNSTSSLHSCANKLRCASLEAIAIPRRYHPLQIVGRVS